MKVKLLELKNFEISKALDFGIKDGDNVKEIFQKINWECEELQTCSYYHCITSSSSFFWQMICMSILVGRSKGKFYL